MTDYYYDYHRALSFDEILYECVKDICVPIIFGHPRTPQRTRRQAELMGQMMGMLSGGGGGDEPAKPNDPNACSALCECTPGKSSISLLSVYTY